MNKETIHKEICNCLLVALHERKIINEATYKQAQKKMKKEKGKAAA